jgi:hypothetical protein
MIEIPHNVYKAEADPEVERIASLVIDELKTCEEATIYRHSVNERNGIYSDKHIAIEVGKLFVKSGYFAALYINDSGYFGWLRISKKPQDNSYSCTEIKA